MRTRTVSERVAHAHNKFRQLNEKKQEQLVEENQRKSKNANFVEDNLFSKRDVSIEKKAGISKKIAPPTAAKPRKPSLNKKSTEDERKGDKVNKNLEKRKPLIRATSVKDRVPLYESQLRVNGIPFKPIGTSNTSFKQSSSEKQSDSSEKKVSNTSLKQKSVKVNGTFKIPSTSDNGNNIVSDEQIYMNQNGYISEDEVTAVEIIPDKSLPDFFNTEFYDLDDDQFRSDSKNNISTDFGISSGINPVETISNRKSNSVFYDNGNNYYVANSSSSFESNESNSSFIKKMPIKLPKTSLTNIEYAKRKFSENESTLETAAFSREYKVASSNNGIPSNHVNTDNENDDCVLLLEGHDIEFAETKFNPQDMDFSDSNGSISQEHIRHMTELKNCINDNRLKKVVVYIEKGYLTIESDESNVGSNSSSVPSSRISLICKGYRIDNFEEAKDIECSSIISQEDQTYLQSMPDDYKLVDDEEFLSQLNKKYFKDPEDSQDDADLEKVDYKMRHHSVSLRQSAVIKSNDGNDETLPNVFENESENEDTHFEDQTVNVMLHRHSNDTKDISNSDTKAKKRLSAVGIQSIIERFSS